MANEQLIQARMVLDSSGFNASLQGVNNNLRQAQSELRNASAQVGAFGRDSERLRGVQEALSSQVQLHTQRVGIYSQSIQTTTEKMNTNIAERDLLRASLVSANTAYAEAVTIHGRESAEAIQAGQAVNGLTEDLTRSERAVQTNANQITRYNTQLNNAQAELARTQGALNLSNTEIANQESRWASAGRTLTTASDNMRTAGEKMSKAGKGLTVGVTMPIVGIGVAAVNSGMEFEAQMSRVKAISQATGGEFTQLNDLALKLGADTAFSAKQAAEGMENLASAGFKTNEIMAAMPGMLNLAASGGIDIATASDIAASSLRAFGLEATQSGHVADVLAKAAADTNAGVTDMGVALKYAGPPAHDLGMSIEEVAASIGIMSNAGIKGDMAGTTLRGSLISLASPSKEAATLMKKIGFDAFDAHGKMLPFNEVIGKLQKSTKGLSDEKKADALATIFGKESLSGMMVLMEAGPAKLDELTKSFKGSDGAAADMAKTMLDNGKGSLDAMKGSIETAAIKLSTVLAPTIKQVADTVTEMANRFADLSPATQETIVKTLALAAALGPIVLVGGKVVGGLGLILKGVAGVSRVMGLASVAAEGATVGVTGLGTGAAATTLLLNPITLGVVGLGIAAVGVGIALNQKVIPAVDLFGGQVSKATEKAVTAYMDLNTKVGVSLLSFQANNTTITAAIASETVGTFETMGTQIKAGRDKHYNEDLATLTKFFTDEGTLNLMDSQTTLANMKRNHAEGSAEVDQSLKDIAAIIKVAKDQGRALEQSELDKIAAIKAKMETQAVNALTSSVNEQNVIFERAKLQATNITTLQAAEVIAASAKQRDETIRLANDAKQKVVDSIARQRAEGVPISDDQANKMIASAENTRAGAVKKAEDMHSQVVSELGRENADVITKLNAQDGSVKTNWQQLDGWFANNPITRWIKTKQGATPSGTTYDDVGNPVAKNASGTNYYPGGLTTMHEEGYEIYAPPRGTKIYNHEASQDMVLKTAQEVAKGMLASSKSGGNVTLKIEKFINNRSQDVQAFAEELEFYRKQVAMGRGGN